MQAADIKALEKRYKKALKAYKARCPFWPFWGLTFALEDAIGSHACWFEASSKRVNQ
jgi:hypothetical protein